MLILLWLTNSVDVFVRHHKMKCWDSLKCLLAKFEVGRSYVWGVNGSSKFKKCVEHNIPLSVMHTMLLIITIFLRVNYYLPIRGLTHAWNIAKSCLFILLQIFLTIHAALRGHTLEPYAWGIHGVYATKVKRSISWFHDFELNLLAFWKQGRWIPKE